MLLHIALPVLVAAVFVFISSSLVHMVFKWHRSDYKRLPDEEALRSALRASAVEPGQYMTPFCIDMKDMQSPEMQAQWKQGPVAVLYVMRSGLPSLGPTLGKWFALNVVVAALVAHVIYTSMGIAIIDGHRLFHVAALTSFLAYAVGSVTSGIWKAQSASSVVKDLLDALIYGAVSGAAFAWLWPTS